MEVRIARSHAAIDESYGQNVLDLTLARCDVKELLENARIVRFLSS